MALAVVLGRHLQGRIPVGGKVVTQVEILPILNVSGCPLESRLPEVKKWPFSADTEVWRQPNRSLVEAVELLAGKLDRPGALHASFLETRGLRRLNLYL